MTDASSSAASPTGPAEPVGVRWPIRLQLLVPMISVVLLATLLAAAIATAWIALRVRREQRDDLRRVVKTLGEATFPLTRPVLMQMRGLSGAEFVLINSKGQVEESTLSLEAERPWSEELARRARSGHLGGDHSEAAVSLGNGDHYLVDSVAVPGRPPMVGSSTVFVLYPEDQLASRIRQAIYPALIAGLVATGIALVIATWLARRLARPIGTLVTRTATIAQGDFTPMPMTPRNDELRDLAESINRMAQQLADYEDQVRRHERLKTLGQLGASLAHQLRNAATGGRMAIELHRRDCPRGSADESLEVALRQLRLMESYLRQFLSIGQPPPVAAQRVNTTGLLEDVLALVRPSYVHAGIDLRFTPPLQPLFLCGDAESLRQLVTNLVVNAAEAAVSDKSTSPHVTVELTQMADSESSTEESPRQAALGSLCVTNTGPGPEPAVSQQLFEAFVTTKPDGCGLGLYVARQIAERHGGRLHWRRVGDKTCFQFDFPIVKQ